MPTARPPRRRRSRDDGDERQRRRTRQRLLEIAGRVFADKGVDRATGKEICARAGANAAAINYHFGSLDGLYTAVLCEAHRRLATLESIRSAIASAASPQARLAAVFRVIVTSLTGPVSSSWVLRVLGREITQPSAAIAVLREQEVRPKLQLVAQIVAELMGLPPTHPAVARSFISVMAPCFMLLVADRRTFKRLFPQFDLAPDHVDAIVEHLVRFALAGMAAVAGEVEGGD